MAIILVDTYLHIIYKEYISRVIMETKQTLEIRVATHLQQALSKAQPAGTKTARLDLSNLKAHKPQVIDDFCANFRFSTWIVLLFPIHALLTSNVGRQTYQGFI